MKQIIYTSIAIVGVMIAAHPALAQSKKKNLSSIAGSIKIQKPKDGKVVISQENLPNSYNRSPLNHASMGQCLNAKIQTIRGELSTLKRWLGDIDAEATEGWNREFKKRLQAGLVKATKDFNTCEPDESYKTEEHRKLRQTVEHLANELYRRSGRGHLVKDSHQPLKTDLLQLIDKAMSDFDTAVTARANVTVDAYSTDARTRQVFAERMRHLCKGLYADKPELIGSCAEEQVKAYETLRKRNFKNAGVTEAVMSGIRVDCKAQYGENYTKRNECERQRIAAWHR